MENGQMFIEQEETKSRFGLTATTLKTIAIIAMAIDHIAWAFVPYGSVLSTVMHFIGRITGPTMFYFAAQGYHHTRNVDRYIGRLAVFALISYFPFIFCFSGGSITELNFTELNVIFTIMLGVIAIRVRREVRNPVLKVLLLCLLLALSVPCDWGATGFLAILIFDFYYNDFKNQAFAYTLLVLLDMGVIYIITMPVMDFLYSGQFTFDIEQFQYLVTNAGAFLPLILLKHYNGEIGGGKHSKWIFYIFYPAHLLVIGLIQFFLKA